MQESGELERIVRKWTEGPEADKTLPDYSAFPASRGTLKMATEGAYAPMNYYRENAVVGMEIDLAARFCEAGGYGLAVEAMNFDGILPAVQTGKADRGGIEYCTSFPQSEGRGAESGRSCSCCRR